MVFTDKTKLSDIKEHFEEYTKCDFLVSGGDFFSGDKRKMTLANLKEANPTWNTSDIIYGLAYLDKLLQNGKADIHTAYSDDEINKNPRLGQVNLVRMGEDNKNRFVLLLSGGAYGAVCTMVEAIPVAGRLCEMGFTCFCLNYRTATLESFVSGLMPEPLEDTAQAVRYIQSKYRFRTEKYTLVGFSAGGHIASLFATDSIGAAKYGVSKPDSLLLAYPLLTMAAMPDSPVKSYMCHGLFGQDYDESKIKEYDSIFNAGEGYPKTYIMRCADDNTIPDGSAPSFANKLKENGVLCSVETGEQGGHGFGLGSATSVRGWVERAAKAVGIVE